MTLSPGYVEPVPPMVSVFTAGWGWMNEAVSNTAPVSATYESADRGVWYDIYVPTTCVATRMWWANGATASANVEAGIYRDAGYKPGAKLVTTGSVAQATTNVVQFADITDTTLTPGLYWLYISCSNGTTTFFRTVYFSAFMDELSRFQQASIGPGSAPATATPVETVNQNIYLFGFSTTTIT